MWKELDTAGHIPLTITRKKRMCVLARVSLLYSVQGPAHKTVRFPVGFPTSNKEIPHRHLHSPAQSIQFLVPSQGSPQPSTAYKVLGTLTGIPTAQHSPFSSWYPHRPALSIEFLVPSEASPLPNTAHIVPGTLTGIPTAQHSPHRFWKR